MMLFFDYFYMQIAYYYKGHKSEKPFDGWKISAISVIAGSTAMLIWLVLLVGYDLFFYIEGMLGERDRRTYVAFSLMFLTIFLFVVFFILFSIRYNKYVSYEQAVGRTNKMSHSKKVLYHILVLLYLLISVPGFFVYAACTAKP